MALDGYGSWQTLVFASFPVYGSDDPIMILPADRNRSKVTIVTDVYVAVAESFAQAADVAVGGIFTTPGVPLYMNTQGEVWAVAHGGTGTVRVAVEGWRA